MGTEQGAKPGDGEKVNSQYLCPGAKGTPRSRGRGDVTSYPIERPSLSHCVRRKKGLVRLAGLRPQARMGDGGGSAMVQVGSRQGQQSRACWGPVSDGRGQGWRRPASGRSGVR